MNEADMPYASTNFNQKEITLNQELISQLISPEAKERIKQRKKLLLQVKDAQASIKKLKRLFS